LKDLDLSTGLKNKSKDQSFRSDIYESPKKDSYHLLHGRKPKHERYIGVVW
jgi:hypothetical protein